MQAVFDSSLNYPWQHGTRQHGLHTSGTLKKKLIKPTTQFIRLLAVVTYQIPSNRRSTFQIINRRPRSSPVEEFWMQMRPRWRLTQFPSCHKRSYGRTHSSVWAYHTDTGTSESSLGLALLTETEIRDSEKLNWKQLETAAYLQDFDPFIIDLRVGRGQEGEEKQRKDERQNSVDGRRVREPVDDAEGGPEEDGDSDAAGPTLERQRSQSTRRLWIQMKDRIRFIKL